MSEEMYIAIRSAIVHNGYPDDLDRMTKAVLQLFSWQSFATAPRDGMEFLARRFSNSLQAYEVRLVYYCPDYAEYPWSSDGNSNNDLFPENYFEEWARIPV